ncbi:MAG: response regulator [Gammaproteobacteria bacterium]
MSTAEYIVYVVDDDPRVREALEDLLAACGIPSIGFGSAAGFIAHEKPDRPACLILDVELPDINGLDLQRQLAGTRHPPIVFITGHGNIPSTVQAMKAGAVDFLPKPVGQQQLLAAIDTAVERDRHKRAVEQELNTLRSRYAVLTPRERQLLPLVVRGVLNKQAAANLGISEVTVQIHRGNIMRKMIARSLSELVRMSLKLGIATDEGTCIPPGAPGSAGTSTGPKRDARNGPAS